MESGLSEIYKLAFRLSRLAALVTAVAFLALHFTKVEISQTLQITIATISLSLGIPHGAIDHLISIPSKPRLKFGAFILVYVAIAILAGLAIAQWSVVGFQCVLVMSALHFGFGDAAYKNEWRDFQNQPRFTRTSSYLYGLASGSLPVFLPLTDHRSFKALVRIHPSIAHWAGSNTHLIRNVVIALAALAVLVQLILRNIQSASDLILLAALSLLAPPLITFAVYFGLWHALRHTARLVPKLPKALMAAEQGKTGLAISRAVLPGLYAIAGTLLVALILMLNRPGQFGSGMLWASLVVVWALTVPHMMATARFDRNALR